MTPIQHKRLRLDQFEDQTPEQDATIPEDLTALTDEQLHELHEQAVEEFNALYGEGDVSEEDMATLNDLTEAIERLAAEVTQREQAAAERAEQAAELARRVNGQDDEPTDEDESDDSGETDESDAEPTDDADDDGETDATDATDETPADTDEQPESVAASSRPKTKEIRLNRAARRRLPKAAQQTSGVSSYLQASGDGTGFSPGTGLDWNQAGSVVNRRLESFNHSQYSRAAQSGKQIRQQMSVATLRREYPDDLTIHNSDPIHVAEVMDRAVNEHRLPQKSLAASGGWCAPSETLYDFLELESATAGLVSLPGIGVSRGGFSFTKGIDYSTIYAEGGFSYTEDEDVAGDYDGAGGGEKPCWHVDCAEFEEARLATAGFCVTAGLLQARGYPELIARSLRGATAAHAHRMNATILNGLATGSDAVAMPTPQAGALAPVLTSIELQATHYRYVHRMAESTTLEAIFPLWVHGVIRADLARRNGVELFAVTNAQINAWFASAGISPQFVYDWQDLTGGASAFTSWPTEVTFLLYAAGTWVRGGSDVITIDTLYDSILLGQNDYTALFTEEGWLLAKRGTDSRAVTVPVCPDGTTAAGIRFACDGTEAAAA